MFRLPFLFIITGLVSFVLFQLLTLFDLAAWIGEDPRNSEGWFRIHLLVLGWASMIAMGAVYQLINVVLQSKIYSERLGFVHYGFFVVGTAGLLIGFQTMRIYWIASFATLAFIGILLFAWNMGATLLRAAQWNAITISTACAVIYLTLTGLTGMAMGLNFGFNLWGSIHEQLFGAHIWFGTLGWFGLLITGFTYKMLPMFYLAHQFPTRMQTMTLLLWNTGVWIGALSFLFNGSLLWKGLGLLFIVLALIAFNVHISQIYRHRHKPKPGAGIIWTLVSARALMVIGIALIPLYALFTDWMLQSPIIVLLGWTYLWGWVAVTILGYLSKIAPFLWWTHKYGPQIGKAKIPTMAQLIDDRKVNIGLASIVTALVLLLLGIGFSLPWLMTVGGCALSLCSLGYIGLIARVFTR
jgi:hypothetical protein